MAIIMNSIYGEPVESWSLASIQQNPLVREDFSSYRSNPMEFLIQYFPDLGPEVSVLHSFDGSTRSRISSSVDYSEKACVDFPPNGFKPPASSRFASAKLSLIFSPEF